MPVGEANFASISVLIGGRVKVESPGGPANSSGEPWIFSGAVSVPGWCSRDGARASEMGTSYELFQVFRPRSAFM